MDDDRRDLPDRAGRPAMTTLTRTRRWRGGSPTSRRAASGSRSRGRPRARPSRSASGTPATWTRRCWRRSRARTGSAGRPSSPAFGENAAADALLPGPVLAALTEQAVSDISSLSDDELTGALQAARRLENRSAWLQTVAIAEFARRRAAQFEDAKARKVPAGRRPGEFPGEELAMELVASGNYADMRIENDLALTARLPKTLAGMAAGLISGDRADVIAGRTTSLSDADAAFADEVLAPVAPACGSTSWPARPPPSR